MTLRRWGLTTIAIIIAFNLFLGVSTSTVWGQLSDVRFTTSDLSIDCERGGVAHAVVSIHNFGVVDEDFRMLFYPPGEEIWVSVFPDPAFTLGAGESYSINVTVRASVSANATAYPLYIYLLVNETLVDNLTLTVIVIEPPSIPSIPGYAWEAVILGLVISGMFVGLVRYRQTRWKKNQ